MAMMELRLSLSIVVKRFTMSFAPGKEAECLKFIEGQADCFVVHQHPLPLVLKNRGHPPGGQNETPQGKQAVV